MVHDVPRAAESVRPISDSEVTRGHVTRPATLSSNATSSVVELDGLQQRQQHDAAALGPFNKQAHGHGREKSSLFWL